jgi:hypothetical protein
MLPHERLEHRLAVETLGAALHDATERLRLAQKRIDALEMQMRREGWTQGDIDSVEPSVHQ